MQIYLKSGFKKTFPQSWSLMDNARSHSAVLEEKTPPYEQHKSWNNSLAVQATMFHTLPHKGMQNCSD